MQEVEDFKQAHKDACDANQETSVMKVKEFEALKQQVSLGNVYLPPVPHNLNCCVGVQYYYVHLMVPVELSVRNSLYCE